MGGDASHPDQDLPGAGPPDVDFVADQALGYEEAEVLEPDESLADPAVHQ